MDNVGLPEEIPRDPVGQVLRHDGESIALVDLGRDASDVLRASWSTDRPFESGGVIDSTWLLPMVGAGSTAASSLLAGNVFLATANPATLMAIGTGVGSAVMGPGGIVAQAPFVAASGALVPVVAPVMLFTTVSSLMICRRLDRAQKTLGQLSEVVERVRRLLDAEDYARFETAAERIDEIRSEFESCRRFASDVPDKLARIDHDVSLLRSKYGLLMTQEVRSEGEAEAFVGDLNRFVLASLYDVRIDVLQLYLALQSDPDAVEFRLSRLRDKIEQYGEDFRQVLADDPVGAYHRTLKEEDRTKPRSSRLLRALRVPLDLPLPRDWPRPFRSERASRVESFRTTRSEFHSVQGHMEQWIEAAEAVTDESRRQSIVFCREPDGDRALRAYHTHDLSLEQAPA